MTSTSQRVARSSMARSDASRFMEREKGTSKPGQIPERNGARARRRRVNCLKQNGAIPHCARGQSSPTFRVSHEQKRTMKAFITISFALLTAALVQAAGPIRVLYLGTGA